MTDTDSRHSVKDLIGYIKRMNKAVLSIDKAIQEIHEEYNSFISLYKEEANSFIKELKEKE